MSTPKDLESQAYTGAIRLAGSILVLSVAFNNIGINFAPVMQALTARIAHSIENPASNKIEERLKAVELLAHKSSKNEH